MKLHHQYIERSSGQVCTEALFADRLVRALYSPLRESAPTMFRALTSARISGVLAFLNYDLPLGTRLTGHRGFLSRSGVDLRECLDPPESLDTARKVFERKIRYWECRPLPEPQQAVVSPADARVLLGTFRETSELFIKDKFFDFKELLGAEKDAWLRAFAEGDFALFRLTPEKYHFNHTPVAGVVVDCYEISGGYHSCHPEAVVAVATPFSKNKRFVTVIDTDVEGGSGVGLVAIVEVVALMIGDIVQCYSEERYDTPRAVSCGMFLRQGQPKSLFRPGSSTDVLIFQKGRIRFAADLLRNQSRRDAQSRFSRGFFHPLVETDVQVRSAIAQAVQGADTSEPGKRHLLHERHEVSQRNSID
jgi:phosphatidylserine decarboxylase